MRQSSLPENRLPLAGLAAVFVLVFLALANDGPRGPNSGSYFEPGGLVGIGLAVVSAIIAIRAYRLGVWISPTHVRIRNLLSTRILLRDDIERLTWRRSKFGTNDVPVLQHSMGKEVRIDALSFSIVQLPWAVRRAKNQLQRIAAELDAPYVEKRS